MFQQPHIFSVVISSAARYESLGSFDGAVAGTGSDAPPRPTYDEHSPLRYARTGEADSRSGWFRCESKVLTIFGVAANLHAVEFDEMIGSILGTLDKAPGEGPVRSSVCPHPVFESDVGQPLLQPGDRHIFDLGNHVRGLCVSRFRRRACLGKDHGGKEVSTKQGSAGTSVHSSPFRGHRHCATPISARVTL